MNVVDSRAWLEYFSGGQNAAYFAPAIEDTGSMIVPVITLYEVFKKILRARGEDPALKAIAVMQQGKIVDVDTSLALVAARLSVEHRLPMADSLILATAHAYEALLWTQDADFAGLPNVRYKR